MFVPNGFIPSNANRTREYDEEGRLRETRIGPGPHTDGDGGIAESNSLFATDAEKVLGTGLRIADCFRAGGRLLAEAGPGAALAPRTSRIRHPSGGRLPRTVGAAAGAAP